MIVSIVLGTLTTIPLKTLTQRKCT